MSKIRNGVRLSLGPSCGEQRSSRNVIKPASEKYKIQLLFRDGCPMVSKKLKDDETSRKGAASESNREFAVEIHVSRLRRESSMLYQTPFHASAGHLWRKSRCGAPSPAPIYPAETHIYRSKPRRHCSSDRITCVVPASDRAASSHSTTPAERPRTVLVELSAVQAHCRRLASGHS